MIGSTCQQFQFLDVFNPRFQISLLIKLGDFEIPFKIIKIQTLFDNSQWAAAVLQWK